MGICIVNGVKYLGEVNWACMSDYHSTPFEQADRISAGWILITKDHEPVLSLVTLFVSKKYRDRLKMMYHVW